MIVFHEKLKTVLTFVSLQVPHELPPEIENLETFKFASNNLTRFLTYFTPNISTWTLSNNPWICDCDAIQFLKFLKYESNKVVDINTTRCGRIGKNTELYGKLIIELTEYDLCPERFRSNTFLGVSPANIGIHKFS
ncbi:carboxypeptidase N subunit 2 [Trichonephila clavipes]|nr:carboxypeptidase N subunit 2 [Trichonephila clavipes]